MDFPLSSSVILFIAVALWIVWVAPYVLRNGGHQLQPAADFLADVMDIEPADPQAGKILKMTAWQETPMTNRNSSPTAAGSTAAGGTDAVRAAVPALKIRYGRLVLALAGVLSLLTGVVSAVLGVVGIGSGWLPVGALLGSAAAVFLLRRLAIRDRRRRMNAAFRDAMSAPARTAPTGPARRQSTDAPRAAAGTGRRETTLFDAQAAPAVPQPGVNPGPKPLTAQDLRAAALAEAAASGDTVAAGDATGPAQPGTEGSSWEPVEVPKPTYVQAPKAERAAPGPLDLPEAPKAVGKPSLKQAAARPAAVELRTEDISDQPAGKAQSALSNLDDVLQRRRA
ncbi:MAG: hypothetical protein ABIO34_13085 [Arthrobacter oryzae]